MTQKRFSEAKINLFLESPAISPVGKGIITQIRSDLSALREAVTNMREAQKSPALIETLMGQMTDCEKLEGEVDALLERMRALTGEHQP